MAHRGLVVLLACSLLPLVTCTTGCQSARRFVRNASPAKRAEADTILTLAQVHEQEGQFKKAEGLYRELHEQDPDNAFVCHHLGVVLIQLGRDDEGRLLIEQANVLQPDSPEILNDLGYSYLLSGEIEQAESILQDAYQLNPDDERTISNLALAVGYGGRYDESLSLYRETLTDAEAYANLGYIAVQRGEGPKALHYYNKALDLDPHLKPAAQAMVQLADLQKRAEGGRSASQQWAAQQRGAEREPIQPPATTGRRSIELTGGNFDWAPNQDSSDGASR
jgi:Flp pilus assembly protein TadD